MPSVLKTVKCKGCKKEFKQNRRGHHWCTKQCYLDNTREQRRSFHMSMFGGKGFTKNRNQLYNSVDQKLEEEYGEGSF